MGWMDKVFNPEQERDRMRADSTLPFAGRIKSVEEKYVENTIRLDEDDKRVLLSIENPYSESDCVKLSKSRENLRDLDPAVVGFLAIKLQKQEEDGVPEREMLH